MFAHHLLSENRNQRRTRAVRGDNLLPLHLQRAWNSKQLNRWGISGEKFAPKGGDRIKDQRRPSSESPFLERKGYGKGQRKKKREPPMRGEPLAKKLVSPSF